MATTETMAIAIIAGTKMYTGIPVSKFKFCTCVVAVNKVDIMLIFSFFYSPIYFVYSSIWLVKAETSSITVPT